MWRDAALQGQAVCFRDGDAALLQAGADPLQEVPLGSGDEHRVTAEADEGLDGAAPLQLGSHPAAPLGQDGQTEAICQSRQDKRRLLRKEDCAPGVHVATGPGGRHFRGQSNQVPDRAAATGYGYAPSEDLRRFAEPNSNGAEVRYGRLKFNILRDCGRDRGNVLITAENRDEVRVGRAAFGTLGDQLGHVDTNVESAIACRLDELKYPEP